jgi:phenylalanyl-tRNA synthetase alpha chain
MTAADSFPSVILSEVPLGGTKSKDLLRSFNWPLRLLERRFMSTLISAFSPPFVPPRNSVQPSPAFSSFLQVFHPLHVFLLEFLPSRLNGFDFTKPPVPDFVDVPMQAEILSLQEQILAAIAAATDADALEAVRIKYLGRQGALPQLLEKMATVPKEERPAVGKAANQAKTAVAAAFDARKAELTAAAEQADFDSTLPGRYEAPGSIHPVLQVRDRAIEIFRQLGFAVADGPDIENEVFNFDALNTPPDHPARNEQDTFYLKEDGLAPSPGLDGKSPGGRRLMRTQTSTVQIRAMLAQPPPIRIIAPGRCYRRDEIDATHGMSFFQMEGLVVGEGVTLADLKGTLEYFFRELLGADLKFRFRPHFFPFTEPSFEVDCAREGSQVKGREWLEICGCGMVDPEVFRQVGYNAEKVTGYAFGFGLERIAIMRHGIPDLRFFTENDVRFLRQFSTRVDA